MTPRHNLLQKQLRPFVSIRSCGPLLVPLKEVETKASCTAQSVHFCCTSPAAIWRIIDRCWSCQDRVLQGHSRATCCAACHSVPHVAISSPWQEAPAWTKPRSCRWSSSALTALPQHQGCLRLTISRASSSAAQIFSAQNEDKARTRHDLWAVTSGGACSMSPWTQVPSEK